MTQRSGPSFFGWVGTQMILAVAVLSPLAALVLNRYYFLLPALFVVVVGLPYSEHRRRSAGQLAAARS